MKCVDCAPVRTSIGNPMPTLIDDNSADDAKQAIETAFMEEKADLSDLLKSLLFMKDLSTSDSKLQAIISY